MSEQPQDKAGEGVNGHFVGVDGTCTPVDPLPTAPPAPPPADSYGTLYKRRWWKTAVIVGILSSIAIGSGNSGGPDGDFDLAVGLVNGLFGFAFGAVFWGTIVNLGVATFPARRSAPAARGGNRRAEGGPSPSLSTLELSEEFLS